MDLYKILEIKKNASLKTITKAYRDKALKYHPDKNPDVDIKKFHEIQTAYEILSDNEKREKYDNLSKDENININLIFSTLLSKIDSFKNFNRIKCQFMNILTNPKNIINIMGLIRKDNIAFDDLLDIVTNLKTNNLLSTETDIEHSEYQQSIKKSTLDIEMTINTNMKDVYNNKSQEIVYLRKINGKDVKESVKVPLIADQVNFEGYGDTSGSLRGDLIVNIMITNNMKYKKKDSDLLIRYEISLYQLFNGLVFSFVHLDDQELTVNIKDCFKYGFDGNKFKVNIDGKGLILINDEEEKRGNLIIQFVLTKDEMFDEKLLRFFS
jgi:DnaJ-class molecular chaperone